MAKLGTDAPLVGYLLAPARVDDGATVSLDGWGNAKLEPEIAVHMGADLAAGASREEAEAAIAGLGVAIELVDLDPDADDPEAILAADIFQRHVLLGPVVEGASAAGVSAARARTATRRLDRRRHRGDRRPGRPRAARREHGRRVGETLRAGEVVICGSVVPALDVAPGDTVEVRLDPLGSLTVYAAGSAPAERPGALLFGTRGVADTPPAELSVPDLGLELPRRGRGRSPRR